MVSALVGSACCEPRLSAHPPIRPSLVLIVRPPPLSFFVCESLVRPSSSLVKLIAHSPEQSGREITDHLSNRVVGNAKLYFGKNYRYEQKRFIGGSRTSHSVGREEGDSSGIRPFEPFSFRLWLGGVPLHTSKQGAIYLNS